VGTAFFLVGLTDLVLLWFPVRFESPAWEFATVGRTLDSLPMAALGLTLAVFGVLKNPRASRSWLRPAAVAFSAATLLVCVLAILFATSAPAVLTATPAEAIGGIERAVIRHSIQAVTYPVCLGICSAFLWRSSRS
jgi:hypothetical protein